MYILGINGGVRMGYQDVSAVLLKDGEVIAAIEEERVSRVKHAPHQLSEKAITEVLDIAGIQITDVDIVATHGETWGDNFGKALKAYFVDTFGYCPTIKRYHHHTCHGASAYYASGYDEALVISIDGSGDGVSTQVCVGRNGKMEVIDRLGRPNSLGLFYSVITQYCGFVKDSGEYKLMGLSSYGDGSKVDMSPLLKLTDKGQYEFDTKYLVKIEPGQAQPSRQQAFFSRELIDLLGPNRTKSMKLDQRLMDISAAAQHKLEEALLHVAKYHVEQTGIKKICLAGGVALNCVANQKLMDSGIADEIFIQPASSDAGISLGAAWLAANEQGFSIPKPEHVYWGRTFSNEAIKDILDQLHVPYSYVEDPSLTAAEAISKGKVVGWFQGGDEFGPRALGCRSILADPTDPDMQSRVNLKIKFRESFRPFCPSVLEEDSPKYFEGAQAIAPYMTITYKVKPEAQKQLPAITHVDGTARIQTVTEKQNARYYKLLKYLKELNGHGVTMNTSFNRNNEPIVHSPIDAVSAFYGSGMDMLVVGNYMLSK